MQRDIQYENGATPPGAKDFDWQCELDAEDAFGVHGIIVEIEGLDLPRDAMDNRGQALKSGDSTLFVSGMKIQGSKAKVPPGLDPTFGSRGFLHEERHRQLEVTGTKTVLVVRIEVDDGITSYSETQLSNSVFGNGIDSLNLQSQYDACSHGELIFTKTTNSGISNGAVTVTLPSNTVSQGDGTIRNAVTTKLATMFGTSSARNLADYVMYCMPSAAMGGIAYAYINSWNSVYKVRPGKPLFHSHRYIIEHSNVHRFPQDVWCTRVSAQMHEIGMLYIWENVVSLHRFAF